MFYTDALDNVLRFGDVIEGQLSVTPILKPLKANYNNNEYSLEIVQSKYSIVLTPCCSVSDDTIVVTPLVHIKSSFLGNPFFAEDLTRINRIMTAQNSVSPQVWSQFSVDYQTQRIEAGEQYALIENFIYEKNDLFTNYNLKLQGGSSISTTYYMVDFRNCTRITSINIRSEEGLFLNKKIAQLTIEARRDLRNKIADYYGRVPKEDIIDED